MFSFLVGRDRNKDIKFEMSGFKNAIASFVTNLAKSYLSLDRPRPPSHKGLQFSVPKEVGLDRNSLLLPPSTLIHPVPMTHAPDLARLLRYVCIILGAPGPVISPGARAFVVLHGQTMHSWYHTGSQVPWRRAIHLTVPILGESRGIEAIAKSMFNTLCDMAGSGCRSLSSYTFQANPEVVSIRLWKDSEESCVSIVLFLQMTTAKPDRDSLAAMDQRLKRVVIDGGNSSVFVYASKQDNMTTLADYARECAALSTRNNSKRTQKKVTDAYNKLDMDRQWCYDEGTKQFGRPGSVKQAFMWPPSVSTVKLVVAVVVILLLAYIIGFTLVPRAGSYLAQRKLRAKRGRILREVMGVV
jgi:hypothetical protein